MYCFVRNDLTQVGGNLINIINMSGNSGASENNFLI